MRPAIDRLLLVLSHVGLLGAAIPALLISGCADPDVSDSFELTGRVTVFADANDGDPVPGARVVFVSDTLIVSETTADETGRYRMIVVSDFPFGQVRASAGGFLDAEQTVLFDTPQRRVDLQMRASMPEP